MLIIRMSTVRALRSLVHASPRYYQVYLAACEEIFTHAVLADFAARGHDLTTQPRPYIGYDTCGAEHNWPAIDALNAYYDQFEAGRSPVKLSVRHCSNMLYLVDPTKIKHIVRCSTGQRVIIYRDINIVWNDEVLWSPADQYSHIGMGFKTCTEQEKRRYYSDWISDSDRMSTVSSPAGAPPQAALKGPPPGLSRPLVRQP